MAGFQLLSRRARRGRAGDTAFASAPRRIHPLESNVVATSGTWAVTGAVLGVLVALALFSPAHWLALAVERATAGHVRLASAQGTLWNGSARVELRGGAGSQDAVALPERVQWRLRPALTGARVELTAACCTPQPLHLDVAPRWSGATVNLTDGQSNWPASLLTGLGTPWNTLQPEGQLQLSTKGLVFDLVQGRAQVRGTAQLQAMQVSSRLSTLRPMGSYRFTLTGGGERITTLQLSTLEGSLQLSGSGEWTASHLRFAGEARAETGREAALANLLNIIGRRDGARSIITIG